jgi:hypothetical protein
MGEFCKEKIKTQREKSFLLLKIPTLQKVTLLRETAPYAAKMVHLKKPLLHTLMI